MKHALAILALALSADPALAQAEGSFPGTLFCDAVPGVAGLRVPIRLTLAGYQASYGVAADYGQPVSVAEKGTGTLAPGGQIVLTGSAKGGGLTYQARYTGGISGRGGLLGGTQTGTAGGKPFTRRCQMSLGNGRG